MYAGQIFDLLEKRRRIYTKKEKERARMRGATTDVFKSLPRYILKMIVVVVICILDWTNAYVVIFFFAKGVLMVLECVILVLMTVAHVIIERLLGQIINVLFALLLYAMIV